MNDKIKDALDRAATKLQNMTKEEFMVKLKECENTGIGEAIVGIYTLPTGEKYVIDNRDN